MCAYNMCVGDQRERIVQNAWERDSESQENRVLGEGGKMWTKITKYKNVKFFSGKTL